MTSTARIGRSVAGAGVLLALGAVGVLLIPPYYENYKLQQYLYALVDDPALKTRSADAVQALVVDHAAQMGLPVRNGDVRIRNEDGVHIQVLYVVRVDLPIYSVDLHFRPGT